MEDLPREELGIYRQEVLTIMGTLADIFVDVRQIKFLLLGEDDEEVEEDDS